MIRYLKKKIYDNEITKNIYKELALIKAKLLFLYMDDKTYTEYKYKSLHGESLNLENPTTFNEKLSLLKLSNRDELTTLCTDKFLVREYVREKIQDDILIELYGVYDNANDIKFDELPNEFVLKGNHGSGYTIVCRDKNRLNLNKTKKTLNNWLRINYYIYSREWNYKNIEPKIICEKLLLGENGGIPEDFRVFCFNGEPKFIAVDLESVNNDGTKKSHYYRNIYNLNWELQNFSIGYESNRDIVVEKPLDLEKMIDYARILSKDFKHVRIDFYYTEGKIYFGELTFCHAGGVGQKAYPEEHSKKIGNLLD